MNKPQKDYLQIAADILDPDMENGDTGLLNSNLIETLSNINRMCLASNGKLISRQAIAVAIYFWEELNPQQKPYGD